MLQATSGKTLLVTAGAMLAGRLRRQPLVAVALLPLSQKQPLLLHPRLHPRQRQRQLLPPLLPLLKSLMLLMHSLISTRPWSSLLVKPSWMI